MLGSGAIEAGFIKEQVLIGNARPSLLIELSLLPDYEEKQLSSEELLKHDQKAGFVIQEKLIQRKRERKEAKWEYEKKTDPEGFKKRQRHRQWRTFRRHPLKFIFDPSKRK